MNLTLFNAQSAATSVVLSVMAPDGSTIGSGQARVPPLGTISANINAFVPQTAFTPQNALDPHPAFTQGKRFRTWSSGPFPMCLERSRPVYVVGTLNAFSDNAQGVVRAAFDPALIPGCRRRAVRRRPYSRCLCKGAIIQRLSRSSIPLMFQRSATLTITGTDGQHLSANPRLFKFPLMVQCEWVYQRCSAFRRVLQVGSLEVDSAVPVISTVALASVAQNGIVVMQPAESANTSFAYRTRATDPQLFLGLALRTPARRRRI